MFLLDIYHEELGILLTSLELYSLPKKGVYFSIDVDKVPSDHPLYGKVVRGKIKEVKKNDEGVYEAFI